MAPYYYDLHLYSLQHLHFKGSPGPERGYGGELQSFQAETWCESILPCPRVSAVNVHFHRNL